MSTFITRIESGGNGLRLAVKDLIDLAGLPTTAGSRAVADHAEPAVADAACMRGARDAERRGELRIVGKTNLHEMALGPTGINPWFGTPVNPLDPTLIPGASSSGSAVAVGSGEADVAYGTDTAGSVRIPSACCGTAALKTTWSRIPLAGVHPLAQSLDTVGPMARDVDGVVTAMQLLEPGFTPAGAPATVVGRLRVPATDPALDDAVDRALRAAELDVVDVEVPGWEAAADATLRVLLIGLWQNNRRWIERYPDGVGDDIRSLAEIGRTSEGELETHQAAAGPWRAELAEVFGRVQVIATPTLKCFPPPLDSWGPMLGGLNTAAVNLAGAPAAVVPVPAPGSRLPGSLQLVGPHGSEELLVTTARLVEDAVR